jgi:Protein of unknown function (DUF2905)
VSARVAAETTVLDDESRARNAARASDRGTMERNIGPLVIVTGLAIVVLGLLVWAGGFSWFGRLPGDIRVERGNVRVYIPWVSMLLISAVLTLLLSVVRYLFRR